MKQLILFVVLACQCIAGHAQSVGIGTTTPHSSAAVEVSSNNKGMLLPRMSSAQRKTIASPAAGLLVFDTDKNCLLMFDGHRWQPILFTSLTNLPGTERTPDSLKTYDNFGFCVDIEGNYAVSGAPADELNGVFERGSAYVFERINGTWIEVARLTAADGAASDHFGYSVAVSGDYIAVSAPDDDSGILPAINSHGSVYIFHRVNNSWVQEAKIVTGEGTAAAGDRFGSSISLSNDNLVVGAPNDDNGAISACGSIYFYQRNGASWSQLNKFFRSVIAANDLFGSAVSINGAYAIAGALYADVGALTSAGSASIYVFGGGTWTWQTTINYPGSINANFGKSVTISSSYAVIGAPAPATGSPGAIYTYERVGSSWVYRSSMGYASPSNLFGLSVSLSGEYLLVAASLENNNAAYLFKKRETSVSWEFVREVKFERSTTTYGQEQNYPDKEIVALDGDNCVFGHPFLGPYAYRSGSILFLNISD